MTNRPLSKRCQSSLFCYKQHPREKMLNNTAASSNGNDLGDVHLLTSPYDSPKAFILAER
jgi:hypothetical protein